MDAELFELAVQVGALKADFLRHFAHVVSFLGNVVFEIAAFQVFAQFAQGQVEVEAAHQFGGLVECELAEHGLHVFPNRFLCSRR